MSCFATRCSGEHSEVHDSRESERAAPGGGIETQRQRRYKVNNNAGSDADEDEDSGSI